MNIWILETINNDGEERRYIYPTYESAIREQKIARELGWATEISCGTLARD